MMREDSVFTTPPHLRTSKPFSSFRSSISLLSRTAKHGPEGMAAASAGVCALMALVLLPSVAALLPSSLLAALALERAIPPIHSDRLGRLRDRNRARHRVKLQTFDGVVDFLVGGNSDPSLRGYRI
ncbi:hypothetical protein NL676_002996 [Syzygium grande]|nr:hypothetical protein NL676_002996 [Syzygium grande]